MNINKILKKLNEPDINKDFFNSKNINKTNNKKNIEEMVEKFKNNDITYLKTLNIKECKEILNFANKQYTNYNHVMNNILYDILKKYILNNENNYDSELSSKFLKKYAMK